MKVIVCSQEDKVGTRKMVTEGTRFDAGISKLEAEDWNEEICLKTGDRSLARVLKALFLEVSLETRG